MPSAYLKSLKLLSLKHIAFVYTENKSGDKTQPCGAPVLKKGPPLRVLL